MMKTRWFWAVGLVLLVTGAWVAAQELQLDPEYVSRAAALRADDAAGHYDLAKWAVKKGLYHEAAAEADKMLALDGGDLRAKYLKQEAEHYGNGATAPAKPPEGEAASTATSAVATGDTVASGAAAPPAVVGGSMSKDQVDQLYKTFEKNVPEFRSTIQLLLVNKCGNDNCHGSSEHSGRFYLKKTALAERTTVAENFRAADAYVNPDSPEQSRLLVMSLAKKEVHKADGAPIFSNENDPGYKLLKAFVLKLPNGAERRWGTSH
jgi:hypothetical protein